MTREKRTEEAARKYAGFNGAEEKITLTDAFKIGAEWALMWHKVADGDLPGGIKGNADDPQFLVKTTDGNLYLAYYSNRDEDGELTQCDFYDDCDLALEAEYWMEIPEFVEE